MIPVRILKESSEKSGLVVGFTTRRDESETRRDGQDETSCLGWLARLGFLDVSPSLSRLDILGISSRLMLASSHRDVSR